MTTSDSKGNLKESAVSTAPSPSNPVAAAVASAGTTGGSGSQPTLAPTNHLEIPTNNPNLLSPDMLSQRRGT